MDASSFDERQRALGRACQGQRSRSSGSSGRMESTMESWRSQGGVYVLLHISGMLVIWTDCAIRSCPRDSS